MPLLSFLLSVRLLRSAGGTAGARAGMRVFSGIAAAALALGATLFPAAGLRAGPIEELKALSGLGDAVDERKLLAGEIISGRGAVGGGSGGFPRGTWVQSCYFVRAPAAQVADAYLHWHPAAHRELDIEVARKYRYPAGPDVFKALNLQPGRAADRPLVEQTRALLAAGGGGSNAPDPGELHLTPADVTRTAGTDADEFWRNVLRARSDAFSSGGLAAVPTYAASAGGGPEINARAEFRSLLKMTPAIAAHFAPLAEARPIVAGAATAADEAVGYWTQGQIRGRTHFALGLLCARKSPGGSWQVLDTTYFTSGTYYYSIDLYQLWPLENGTLVWQVDYISAGFRPYAIGLDKVLAAREILKDTGVSIRLFRRDVESGGGTGLQRAR